MKIKLLTTNGRTKPLLFCDLCDKEITEALGAEYLIPDGEGVKHPIIGHTKCTTAYEDVNSTDKVGFGNMGLDLLLLYLINDLRVDIDKSAMNAYGLSGLDIYETEEG